jgi:PhnB protein
MWVCLSDAGDSVGSLDDQALQREATMQSRLNPYIGFRDNARQAMEFYHSVFGGDLQVNTFKDFHASEDPSEDDKVMHSMLEADNGMVLMAADTPNSMEHNPGSHISVSLSGDDHAELSGYYEKLSDGGQVVMPLEKAPWGDHFGMCVDKFGVSWMVNIAGTQ